LGIIRLDNIRDDGGPVRADEKDAVYLIKRKKRPLIHRTKRNCGAKEINLR